MRISALLAILLWGLASVCGASDSARQGSSPSTAASPLSADWFSPYTVPRYDFVKLPAPDRSDWVYRGFNPERGGDVFCLKMHIFEVKRESPHSDVTVPQAQWTCQPASKYSLKTTDEPAQAPSR